MDLYKFIGALMIIFEQNNIYEIVGLPGGIYNFSYLFLSIVDIKTLPNKVGTILKGLNAVSG